MEAMPSQVEYNDSNIHVLSSGTAIVALDIRPMHCIDGRAGSWLDQSKEIVLGLYTKSRNISAVATEFYEVTGNHIGTSTIHNWLMKFKTCNACNENEFNALNILGKYTPRNKSKSAIVLQFIKDNPACLQWPKKEYRIGIKFNVSHHIVTWAIKRYRGYVKAMHTSSVSESESSH